MQRSIYLLMKDMHNVDSVFEMQKDLDFLECAFREIHARYKECVESDPDELDASEKYFEQYMKQVYDLKEQLELWNVVAVRLRDAARALDPRDGSPADVTEHINDNHSVGSCSHALLAARQNVAARKAALMTEAAAQKQLQDIQRQELLLSQKKRELELQLEIDKAEAEENAYSMLDISAGSQHSGLKNITPCVKLEYVEKWRQSQLAPPVTLSPPRIASTPVHTQISASDQKMQQLLDNMSLPKTELMKFDGDPISYWTFIR